MFHNFITNMKPLVPTVECSALISTTPECSRLGFVKANPLEWHLNLPLEWKSQEELNLLVYRFGYKARFQNGTHWKSLGVLYPNQGQTMSNTEFLGPQSQFLSFQVLMPKTSDNGCSGKLATINANFNEKVFS